MTDASDPQDRPQRQFVPPRFGLSAKLLLLTIPLVMIAEVLIYVPSIANFRINRLNDRLAAANTAALVLNAAPSGMVPDSLAREILSSIGARAVAIKMGQQRRLLAIADMPPAIDHDVDMRSMTAWSAIMDAFEVMLESGNQAIRVIGPAPGNNGQFLEVVVDELPLRQAMYRFSRNLLLLSLVIAILTAALVYLALHYLFVRPMRRLTANLVAYHADPESPARIIPASDRGDEIGVAERELADMQRDLVSMLHQKSRLAALGLAVSKINHDLRNLLASSQLISDQLAHVPDPRVQRFAPKLVRSLERAIAFCQSTLSYGRAQEAAPDRRMVALEPIVNEVRESAGLAADTSIVWVNAVERGLTVDADPDQLFRVLLNLVRNAAQALGSESVGPGVTKQIRVTGRREGSVAIIEVSDTGPGVPPKARDHLFEPFQGSSRDGGTGLGLVIAAELVRAHGGEMNLVEGTIGATFRISIPDRPVQLYSPRLERIRA
ncbi:HAMP domain-containing histidine kinase [Bradyrhizobium sp. U87765 SZCCT0131]|uniref:ATP-binding protein n=1 Tax=unclassified Bradyrhizobium TaxID=2631580 RepID=UPI001BAA2D27|nr:MULTISPECIES: HAMP domain-containing sensor histidine kinase [unclassified Bradyrhizobium]MBR1217419.1 HAMP domain-containing histidine kinase [Bradyrhizobium sp. U87765 SZCCT0131]MBR1264984.1 HAMP domain-containing histidine kinase [Bradyrhizobium sp. U87765 SZCCT0134]MBR1304966.1 HAMP domain-containing histidine kinase [Bradyrhizobium sp. U87765 SZCCT0110]MBR1320752.1 HAMP domain-containing histidine kinase [Bradyrhizobium sp. U87765 SZCCT0109]MBR1349172.1 HAMP domain-containing histidine